MTGLVQKILSCHQSLSKNDVPHAFGGALALAWCTKSARGTIDIDINIFTNTDQAENVIAALPIGVKHTKKDLKELIRETQIRLWWESTPVDIFLNSTPYHEEVQTRIKWEIFAGSEVPFLCCRDLSVFKAFFNRTKDWADLEAMMAVGTLDIDFTSNILIKYLGNQDERLEKLQQLAMSRRD